MPNLDEAELFTVARQIQSPEARRRYLQEACGDDQKLLARIEALLRVHEEERSFLAAPAVSLPATTAPDEREVAGAHIGPYQLLKQIGEGGFGVVFLAEQQHPLRRSVALKVLKPGMDTRQVVARFEAERQALALMDHPNIARVLDGGATAAGRPYFVMELVKGVPITRYCDDHRLTPRERLDLFVAVCQAVQHAHQKGLIHRDLKPSNILVADYDGRPVPKVIDFGVARALGQPLTEHTLVTGRGSVIGTLEYMSPEQAEFNACDIDTRADIYSLGVLLYELLTGTTPLTRERLSRTPITDVLRLIREEEPPRPSTRLNESKTSLPVSAQRQLRGDLDWIVMKALEKDRTRRFETAGAFAADVQRYLNDEPVLASPPSKVYRLRKFVRRNRGAVLAAVLITLALVGGIVGTTWGLIRATDERAVAEQETRQKETALADAREQLLEALWQQARAGRFSRQPGQRLDSLDALAKAARIRSDERLRDEAIAAMALPDVRRVPGWHARSPGTAVVAYGGNYRLYAAGSESISLRSIPDDREIRRIASGPILDLQFSPDDRFLLGLSVGETLNVWRVADGQPALRDKPGGCRGYAFSPDGQRLAVGQQEWLLIFDLATGREVKRWRLPARANSLAFHPDSSKLAVGYFEASVTSVYTAATGSLLWDLPVGQLNNQVVAWHPDGERLAVSGGDPRIGIWNWPSRSKVATLEGHVMQVMALTFHPDGELLASYGWDGQLLLWHPSSERHLMRLASVTAPRFSVDGRWLGVAWNGDRADLLEVTPCREYRTLASRRSGPGVGFEYGDISPDGRMLVTSVYSVATVWSLDSGRPVYFQQAGTPFAFFEGKRGEEGRPSAGAPVSLVTCGASGLVRHPITIYDPGRNRVGLGPIQRLSPLHRAWFARSPNGRTLVSVTDGGGTANQILDLETGAVRRELGPHPDGEVQALSGDGRWAASCGRISRHVRLWNVGTGEMVREWFVGLQPHVFFTPDSRALIIAGGDEFSFWDVESRQLVRRLPREITQFPGWVAFSADGRLMAMEMTPGVLHLKEAVTGRTVARLEDPHGDRATWQGFTPDGTRLVVMARTTGAIHVWDLRAIRARLKEMNLDWD